MFHKLVVMALNVLYEYFYAKCGQKDLKKENDF